MHAAVRLPLFVALAAAGWWFAQSPHRDRKVAEKT
jgi:hypothetical protein